MRWLHREERLGAPSDAGVALSPRSRLLPYAASLGLAFLAVYAGVLRSLGQSWTSRDDYSHGFLVPVISLYFVYLKREEIRRLPVNPELLPGFLLTAAGSALLAAGTVGGVVTLQHLSLLVTLPGLVLLFFGRAWLRSLALPLGYLAFMVPSALGVIASRIQWPFQLFTAAVSTNLLQALGVPVYRQANYLHLPEITLEVARACSGVNYLVTIMALGLPLAYLTQRSWPRRLLLVLAGLVVGIAANPARVTLIGLWAHRGGEVVHGPLHILQALSVSIIGFLALALFAWLLNVLFPEKSPAGEVPPAAGSSGGVPGSARLRRAWLGGLAALVLLPGYLLLFKQQAVPLRLPLERLPCVIGRWHCQEQGSVGTPFPTPGVDAELIRRYRDGAGNALTLYIGYLEAQRQGKELIGYDRDDLYRDARPLAVPLRAGGSLKVNRTVAAGRGGSYLALYWYDLNGVRVADNRKAKFHTLLDGLLRRRTNGALILVSAPLQAGAGEEASSRLAADFTAGLAEVLDGYFL